jgi:UDP-N-acetylmuramyl pentapeptide phosphotransferase/UDP-N-acetylglucosamine-1-phosphate transferase
MPIFASPFIAAALAAVLAAAALWLILRARGRLPQARPNARSLHARPVPRVGGLALWAGFLPVALAAPSPVPTGKAWVLSWTAIAVVSLIDDWRGADAWTRLAVQAAAAALAVLASLPGAASTAAYAVIAAGAIAVVVWAANLYNFMDGSDGLAAAMAVVGFAAYGAAATAADAPAAVYFALAAAALPLLALNWPPARVFMGDVGAAPLGFLAGFFGLNGWAYDLWPAWFPLLVFLPFIADATLTLAQRLVREESLFEAHRSHYYQRLHRLGAGHAGTLLVYGALMAGTATAALAVVAFAPAYGWIVVGAWTIALGAFFAAVDYHWSRRRDSAQ